MEGSPPSRRQLARCRRLLHLRLLRPRAAAAALACRGGPVVGGMKQSRGNDRQTLIGEHADRPTGILGNVSQLWLGCSPALLSQPVAWRRRLQQRANDHDGHGEDCDRQVVPPAPTSVSSRLNRTWKHYFLLGPKLRGAIRNCVATGRRIEFDIANHDEAGLGPGRNTLKERNASPDLPHRGPAFRGGC